MVITDNLNIIEKQRINHRKQSKNIKIEIKLGMMVLICNLNYSRGLSKRITSCA